MAKQKYRDSLIWGIILIVVGGVFLLETLHVRVWHYVWRLWPVIFIAWGANKLYYGLKERGRGKPEPPAPARD
ncbi:MAG: LiaI-LiaF-like domain-containing protein [Candidatus Aminicenantales bacterium]